MTQPGGARESKQTARERAGEERKAAAQAQAQRDKLVRGGLVALVLLVVLGVGLMVILTRKTTVAADGFARPAGVLADGGIPTGTASAPLLDVYEDFQCPACKVFEVNIGADVRAAATNGKAKVIYHMLKFLDGNLKNDASARSANAGGCAQDQGKFLAFHDVVYQNQPTEEGAGYTDDQLVAFGKSAGVLDSAKFAACVKAQTFKDWVTAVQADGNARPVTGTPSYFVDGKLIDFGAAKAVGDLRGIFLKAIGQS